MLALPPDDGGFLVPPPETLGGLGWITSAPLSPLRGTLQPTSEPGAAGGAQTGWRAQFLAMIRNKQLRGATY